MRADREEGLLRASLLEERRIALPEDLHGIPLARPGAGLFLEACRAASSAGAD